MKIVIFYYEQTLISICCNDADMTSCIMRRFKPYSLLHTLQQFALNNLQTLPRPSHVHFASEAPSKRKMLQET